MPNWFNTENSPGLRTLDERVTGLDPLRKNIKTWQNVAPVSVLDVGCAEGLISDWITESHGKITGIDGDPDKIATAKKLMPKQTFLKGDAADITAVLKNEDQYDIVLLLAILQKLNDPMPLLNEAFKRAKKTVAIRVPDYWFKQYWTPEFYSTIKAEWYVAHHSPAKEPDEHFLGHLLILNRHHVPKELTALRATMKATSRNKAVTDADVNVVSFPKSGRTWLRYYLATWLNLEYNQGMDLELTPQPYWTEERYKVPFPKIHFTHDFFDLNQDNSFPPMVTYAETYEKKKTVFLVRNPFDTIVSYYFHKAKREAVTQLTLNEFLMSPTYGVARYCNWLTQMLDFVQTHPNVLVISYEDMRKSMSRQMRRLFDYIDVEDSLDHIPVASKLSGFKAMQKAEIEANAKAELGIGRLAMSNWDGDFQKLKVRKGEVGSWRDEIDEVILPKILELPEVKACLAKLRVVCPSASPLL